VVRYRDERLGRACLLAALELVLAAVHDQPYDVTQEVRKLRELADRVCLGPSTAAIVAAAGARGIPVRRLNEGSLVQLGQGAKQRRIWTAETDRTSAVAESIAQDKELTKTLLSAGGIPVPEGRSVSDAGAGQDAGRTACVAFSDFTIAIRRRRHRGRRGSNGKVSRADADICVVAFIACYSGSQGCSS
jgi:cyanophycin synthetase